MRLPESVFLSGPWASVTLVQVTLVALLGCLAWLAARRGGPALRAAILLAALVGLLLAPAFASVAPVWLSLPEWICPSGDQPPADSSDGVPESPPSSPADSAVFALLVAQPPAKDPSPPEGPAKQAGENAPPMKAEAVVINLVSPSEDPVPPARPSALPHPPWSPAGLLASLWLFGAAVCLARALARLALLYRRSWQARPIRESVWTDCLESLTKCHDLPVVALRESWEFAAPLTLGLFRPVILLPRCRRGWSAEQRTLILEHELAHVRRRDFLAGLVAELAVCLCWFHPLVRWLAGRLRLEQEYAADAWVASAAADPADYVRCLARLALELDRGHGSLAPAFWRRRPEILRRIDMLRRNPQGLPTRLGKRAGWTVAVLAAASCLVAGGVGPLHSADGRPSTEAVPEANNKATADRLGDPLPAGARARLGTTRMRHGSEVTFVAFGSGGKTLLTAGRDNTVRLWDLATGKEIRRFAQPKPANPKPPGKENNPKNDKASVDVMIQMMGGGGNDGGSLRVALTADGKTLGVGRGGVIQLYNVETGAALRQIQAKANRLTGLLFSPDGKTLAARSGNNTLFLWATESGKELHQIKSPPRPQRDGFVFIVGGGGDANAPGMAFTPDGKALAAAATDYKKEAEIHSVKFWDVDTGKEVRKIDAKADVNVVAVAPDGEVVAYGVGNIVNLCEVKTGKELRQIKTPGRIAALAFTPDGKTLAVRKGNQRVGLWDTQTGKELHHLSDAQTIQRSGGGLVLLLPGFSAPETRALAISADSKRVVSAAGSTVRLWETATGKELPLSDGHWKAPNTLTLSQDGKTVVSWGDDRVVRRWEAATGKLLGAFSAPPRTTRAALSSDGRTVALANADNTIRLYDTGTGKELHQFKSHANGTASLAFSPDGKMLASRDSADNSILLFDVGAGRELRRIVLRARREPAQGTVVIFGGGGGSGGTGAGMSFSPDGQLLVAPGPGGGDSGNTLVLLDVAAGKELRKIELPQPITSLAFAPNGRTLATENADRTITLWEVASGKKRTQLGKAAANRPQPNGRDMRVSFVIDGMGGGFSEPAGPVGLAFSPDGRALAARGADLSVRVWDVIAGKEIGQLKGHGGRIETVAFAADGKTLASGATDTTILLWDTADPLKELAKAPTVELPAAEVKTLWGDLARDDAAKAFGGVLKLSAAPRQAVPFLSERLKPAARIDPRKIDAWIGELDSEKYAVRQEAAENLLKAGEQAVPALRKVLASRPALETRKRVEQLVDKLTSGTLSAEQLRLIRALEALERIGTPEARQVLRTLAQGAPGALPTREAQAALNRLAHSPASRP
jgi:WD40 repeat protein/beta-lactamase regulating signal transducer with metallopeptidase domain